MIQEHYDFYVRKFAKAKKLKFRKAYFYWANVLTERIINIFEWNGINFKQKEIEILLHYIGYCGILKFPKGKELGVTFGSMSGVTNYPDEFTTWTWSTPLQNGMNKIGVDCVIVNNNQTRFPTYQIVEIYASLLAHVDLSLQAILINSRCSAITKASTQEQVDAMAAWYTSLTNGDSMAVLDKSNFDNLIGEEGIKVLGSLVPANLKIDDYYQIRENLLKSFYSEIGINSNRDKRERVVTEELDSNLNRILFNIEDMLKERQDACKQINAMFGTNWSVKFNKEIELQKLKEETDNVGHVSDDNTSSQNES